MSDDIRLIKSELMRKGIEEIPAMKAAPVIEFFHRTSVGRAGRRVSQILLEADLLNPDSPRGYRFPQERYSEYAKSISPDRAYDICDEICVGLEVGLHVGWLSSDNKVRYSLSGKGFEDLNTLLGTNKS